ncbi:peptidoglycan-associated lipoprotein Pal [Suttonella sp. R2A3]|uniref:peptidoglycan-associated lipoprotein Pal n=1 Tax=Suttonella sp. R2A3 TaxID=2908648 RepID=UPI001F214E85|nr:peptidoglycan-associated lipoprotein Pal [Suttonella sp. R2A3]UJF24417.1 peptidoglycan-associated lipoprotein Pal [Suttonella sp. R2A3]
MAAFALVLAGCSKPYQVEGGQNGAMGNGNPYGGQGDSYGNGSGGSYGNFYDDPTYGVNVVGGPAATEKDRVIYFSFDSSSIDNRSHNVIAQHAAYLKNNPQTAVVLEGHTDERGTREYNIGLGERRAYSVKDVFAQNGVNANQMRVLSYGEERPAVWGSDENSYARNRRVVIVY